MKGNSGENAQSPQGTEPKKKLRLFEKAERSPLLDTEKEEIGWIDAIKRFEEQIYPLVFKTKGFSLPEAMLLWELNKLGNYMDEVIELLTEEGT